MSITGKDRFRIVFMGTPGFAVPSLEALLDGPDRVEAVVTMPDRPCGRGRSCAPPPVKSLALAARVPVFQPERLPEIREQLMEIAPDFLVVVAYGKILRPWLLDLPRHAPINVHASSLPELRGAAPIQWAVVRGLEETGVSIMKMDEGMDTGPVILQRREPILPGDNSATLCERLSRRGAGALMEALEQFQRGQVEMAEQDDQRATYAPMITKGDGHIDWSMESQQLDCFVRGMFPWPGAFTCAGEKMLKVLAVQPLGDGGIRDAVLCLRERGETPKIGEVLGLDSARGPLVACGPAGAEVVALTRVQPQGGRPMDGRSYVNGKPAPPGTILS